MLRLKLAVACRVFGTSVPRAMRAAAELGAQAMQFDARLELRALDLSETGIRQFLHRLGEYQLTVSSLSFALRRPLFASEQLERRVTAIKSAMSLARQLRTDVLAVPVGRVPADQDSREFLTLQEVLEDLTQYGNRIGTSLALMPANTAASELRELADSLASGLLGVDFDPASCVMRGESVVDAFRQVHDLIRHIRVRDATRNVEGQGSEVPVGAGEVAWDELLALVDEAAFRGWMTLDRTQGNDRPGDCARGIRFLRKVVEV